MTQKEMFAAIVAGEVNDEVVAKAQECLDSIEASNAKRAAKNDAAKAEHIALTKEIVASLDETPKTASDIAEVFGIKPQAVSTYLRLYADGEFAKVDVKVDGKKRVGYVKA